jgi:hypothetical protein
VHVVAVVGEEGAGAAVDPAAVDEQRLDAVIRAFYCARGGG